MTKTQTKRLIRLAGRLLACGVLFSSLGGFNKVGLYGDCEDTNRTPCVTWDENQWRLVKSYEPYKYQKVTLIHRFKGNRYLVKK